jgi:membrane-associated protease RseP (regulator of RpoE activity)
MLSVLGEHENERKEFAPKSQETPRFLREASGPRFGRGCLHCHQVKERFNSDLRRAGKWSRENVWRYPLPENVGLTLDVDHGNVIKSVNADSPAFKAGLKAGDTLGRLHGVPIHSFADTQYALDRAPGAGEIDILWRHGGKVQKGKLSLPDGWRKSDISWRASMRHMVPAPRFYGPNLKPDEKKLLGLAPNQLAFRQGDYLSKILLAAGFRAGDIILGVDGKPFETDCDGFRRYVQQHYLVGDRVTINLLRDGKRQDLSMTLQP